MWELSTHVPNKGYGVKSQELWGHKRHENPAHTPGVCTLALLLQEPPSCQKEVRAGVGRLAAEMWRHYALSTTHLRYSYVFKGHIKEFVVLAVCFFFFEISGQDNMLS